MFLYVQLRLFNLIYSLKLQENYLHHKDSANKENR